MITRRVAALCFCIYMCHETAGAGAEVHKETAGARYRCPLDIIAISLACCEHHKIILTLDRPVSLIDS